MLDGEIATVKCATLDTLRTAFDGFRVDRHGNLWASTGRGVDVFAPDGKLIGRIPIPELVSNVCFVGPNRNRLFITAQTSLYAIFVNSGPAVVI